MSSSESLLKEIKGLPREGESLRRCEEIISLLNKREDDTSANALAKALYLKALILEDIREYSKAVAACAALQAHVERSKLPHAQEILSAARISASLGRHFERLDFGQIRTQDPSARIQATLKTEIRQKRVYALLKFENISQDEIQFSKSTSCRDGRLYQNVFEVRLGGMKLNASHSRMARTKEEEFIV